VPGIVFICENEFCREAAYLNHALSADAKSRAAEVRRYLSKLFMRYLSYFLLISSVALYGCIRNTPDPDRCTWGNYVTLYKEFEISYQLPPLPKGSKYGRSKYFLSTKPQRYIPTGTQGFVGIHYDFGYEIPQFRLTCTLWEYPSEYKGKPDFDIFYEDFKNILIEKNANFESSKLQIKGRKYMFTRFYNAKRGNIIRVEAYSTPIDDKYYLDIFAEYDYIMVQKSIDWLKSRQEIFADIANSFSVTKR